MDCTVSGVAHHPTCGPACHTTQLNVTFIGRAGEHLSDLDRILESIDFRWMPELLEIYRYPSS
jgi:hypothetical protein